MSNSTSDVYKPNDPHHSLSIALATALNSSDQAIFMNHIGYWLAYNERMERNFHEGKYWTYQTLQELHGHFPYWSVKQLRNIIDKLVKSGILIKGNFNSNKYDQTLWYTIDWEKVKSICPNGQMEKSERADRNDQKGKPIPDNITHNRTNDIPIAFGQFVKFTQEQYDSLCKDHTKSHVDEIIQSMNDYCVNNRPKGYKDYIAAFRTFVKNYKSKATRLTGIPSNKEKVLKKFKHGEIYNGTECFIDDESIAFQRGMTHISLRFKEFGFDEQLANILRKFGIEY